MCPRAALLPSSQSVRNDNAVLAEIRRKKQLTCCENHSAAYSHYPTAQLYAWLPSSRCGHRIVRSSSRGGGLTTTLETIVTSYRPTVLPANPEKVVFYGTTVASLKAWSRDTIDPLCCWHLSMLKQTSCTTPLATTSLPAAWRLQTYRGILSHGTERDSTQCSVSAGIPSHCSVDFYASSRQYTRHVGQRWTSGLRARVHG